MVGQAVIQVRKTGAINAVVEIEFLIAVKHQENRAHGRTLQLRFLAIFLILHWLGDQNSAFASQCVLIV